MFRSIFAVVGRALSSLRRIGGKIKAGVYQPLEYTWGAWNHVWEDVETAVTAPFRAVGHAATRTAELGAAAVSLPFAAVGAGIGAAFAGRQSAGDAEVAQAAQQVSRLEQDAAAEEQEPAPAKAPTAWKVARAVARAVLTGSERPSTDHLPLNVRSFLLSMTPAQARIVWSAQAPVLHEFLAGRGEIKGLKLDAEYPDVSHIDTDVLIEETFRSAREGSAKIANAPAAKKDDEPESSSSLKI